jgi:hypothetical protein
VPTAAVDLSRSTFLLCGRFGLLILHVLLKEQADIIAQRPAILVSKALQLVAHLEGRRMFTLVSRFMHAA